MRRHLQADVAAFHARFGHPWREEPGLPLTEDGEIDEAWIQFRKERIMEEARELCAAIDERDLAHIAREACDQVYVALGCLLIFGIEFESCWEEVQRANMAKEPHPDGHLGKPIKPPGWVPPQLERVLDVQRTRLRNPEMMDRYLREKAGLDRGPMRAIVWSVLLMGAGAAVALALTYL